MIKSILRGALILLILGVVLAAAQEVYNVFGRDPVFMAQTMSLTALGIGLCFLIGRAAEWILDID